MTQVFRESGKSPRARREQIGGLQRAPIFVLEGFANVAASTWPSSHCKHAGLHYSGLLLRGALRQKLGKGQDAVAEFDQAVKLNPNDEELLGLRANAYLTAGQFQKAVDDYTRAIEINPRSSGTFLKLRARAYQKLGQQALSEADMHALAQVENVHQKKAR